MLTNLYQSFPSEVCTSSTTIRTKGEILFKGYTCFSLHMTDLQNFYNNSKTIFNFFLYIQFYYNTTTVRLSPYKASFYKISLYVIVFINQCLFQSFNHLEHKTQFFYRLSFYKYPMF